VLSPSGIVLTNDHVIRGATIIRVTVVGSGRRYAATVVGYDPAADVAVLQIRSAPALETVTLGNSAGVKRGDPVTAVGNANGAGGAPAVTTGKVTRVGRSITVSDDSGDPQRLSGLIETDASLEPGDSGGPLLDGNGRVIGIDTAASSDFFLRAGNRGFAIPINRAISIAKQLQAGHATPTGHVGPTAFLGVGVSSPGDSLGSGLQTGALVTDVVNGSPADRAGIADGDVITSVDGHAVNGPTALTRMLLRDSPGMSVRLVWIDAFASEQHATVRLATGPPH
jgi:S1-C subfamily serine protease